jgi:hypothetical protein
VCILSINIKHCEFRSKVTKHRTKETSNFSLDERDRRLVIMAVVIKLNGFVKIEICKYNSLHHQKITSGIKQYRQIHMYSAKRKAMHSSRPEKEAEDD